MTRKILATLDGSRTSESILPYLEALLRSEDANVTLARAALSDGLKEKQEVRSYLKGVAASLEAKGAVVDTAILEGKPAEGIVNHAIHGGYDLIVMCTRGKTGLKRLILGSVTEEILRLSPKPVLVVHPLERGGIAPAIRRIAVPLDGSHRSGSILPQVADLAKAMGAKISFVTVVSPTKKDDLPVEVVSENIFREQKALQKRGLEVDIAILYGDPVVETLGYAERNHADLVAISTHGRSGLDRLRFGSVAEKILRKSPLPLLVLRTAAIPKQYTLHKAGLKARRRALAVIASAGDMKKGPYNR